MVDARYRLVSEYRSHDYRLRAYRAIRRSTVFQNYSEKTATNKVKGSYPKLSLKVIIRYAGWILANNLFQPR
jgi:hypothetical protein